MVGSGGAASTARAGPTGNTRGDITAANHIEAVTLVLRVHGRSQAGPVSWQGRDAQNR